MPVKDIIEVNKKAFRAYLGSFVNELLAKNFCPDCKQEIIKSYKEVISNINPVH